MRWLKGNSCWLVLDYLLLTTSSWTLWRHESLLLPLELWWRDVNVVYKPWTSTLRLRCVPRGVEDYPTLASCISNWGLEAIVSPNHHQRVIWLACCEISFRSVPSKVQGVSCPYWNLTFALPHVIYSSSVSQLEQSQICESLVLKISLDAPPEEYRLPPPIPP